MKIFQTQLQGLLNKLAEQEDVMEDAARVMAQSIVSDGQLWIFAEKELKGVVHQGIEGVDSLPTAKAARIESPFSSMDCLLVFSPDSGSEAVAKLVDVALEKGVQVIGVSSRRDEGWMEKCSFPLASGVTGGLVPTEDGGRIGEPHLLVALHIYYGLFFTVKEILEEYGLE